MVAPASTDDFEAALKLIVHQKTSAILKDPVKLRGILRDYAPKSRRESEILLVALEEGFQDQITALKGVAVSATEHAHLVDQLSGAHGYDKTVVDVALAALESVLGKIPSHIAPPPPAAPAAGPRPSRPRPAAAVPSKSGGGAPPPKCPRCTFGQMFLEPTGWRCNICKYEPAATPSAPTHAPVSAPPPPPPMSASVPFPATVFPSGPVKSAASHRQIGRQSIVAWLLIGGVYGSINGFLMSVIYFGSKKASVLELQLLGPTLERDAVFGWVLGLIVVPIAIWFWTNDFNEYFQVAGLCALSGGVEGGYVWMTHLGITQVLPGILLGFAVGGLIGLVSAFGPAVAGAIVVTTYVGGTLGAGIHNEYVWILSVAAGLLMGGVTAGFMENEMPSGIRDVSAWKLWGWSILSCSMIGFIVAWVFNQADWDIGLSVGFLAAVVGGGMQFLFSA